MCECLEGLGRGSRSLENKLHRAVSNWKAMYLFRCGSKHKGGMWKESLSRSRYVLAWEFGYVTRVPQHVLFVVCLLFFQSKMLQANMIGNNCDQLLGGASTSRASTPVSDCV